MTKVYERIDTLSRLPGTLQEYEDLYIMLRNLSRSELEAAVSKHNLLDIFGHIDLGNNDFSEVALNIAEVVFSTFRLTEFSRSHETELLMSITSRNIPLRDFVIARLVDGVENSPPEDIDMPMKILLEISINHPEGVKTLLKDPPLRSYFESLTGDEEVIRLSEIFAYIASQRKGTFKEMIDCSVFDRLISVLNKADPLLQLNTLAVLKLLLTFPDGRAFLKSRGAVAHLFSSLQTLKENPLHDILLPGYLSFFATLAEEEPMDFLTNPIYRQPLVSCLASYLTTSDPTITVAVTETVAQICRTTDGKRALAAYLEPGACLTPLLSKAASVMLNASASTLPRILLALADILSLPNVDAVSALIPISELTYQWFNLISAPSPPTRLLGRIWEMARQPFKEVRLAALNLLRAIATEPWGVALFAQVSGFLEYLFNPTTEVGTAVDGSSLQPEKFKIIEQCDLTQGRWKGYVTRWTLLNDETAAKLKKRVKDGVWGHTRSQAAVAMENEVFMYVK
ncbi:26S proteasome non ATPase regulatory subunit 5 [Echinococcus multilocularis]|uniref:26S proteasome non-ATPase regulatory subunit 5 n=1 Tax=Echinococcus multilocularis TaxID=6211 RepID=A0A087W0V3_ECHMU|nr:26S proteasome non ATPase regulatory subunit 5 [Echinococcus multilocularis]